MGWRRPVARFTGGTLVAIGLLAVALGAGGAVVSSLAESQALETRAPDGSVRGLPVAAAFVVGLAPVFAAGVGIYRERYGAVTAVGATLYAAAALTVGHGLTPTGVSQYLPRMTAIVLGVTGGLLCLAMLPLSVVHGTVRVQEREETEDTLEGVARAFFGPAFPVVVVLAIAGGLLVGVDGGHGVWMPFVAAVTPFLAAGALGLRDAVETERFGDLSAVDHALWMLGTRPLFAASVAVLGVLSVTTVAYPLGLAEGPLLYEGLTPGRLLGVVAVTYGVGAAAVLPSANDRLTAWRDAAAEDTADGGVTVLDAEGGPGLPRTVRVVHLHADEGRARMVTDREVDVPTRSVETVGESREADAEDLVVARDGPRVHVRTADGDVTLRPYGDPDRVVAALGGHHAVGGRPASRDRRDRTDAGESAGAGGGG